MFFVLLLCFSLFTAKQQHQPLFGSPSGTGDAASSETGASTNGEREHLSVDPSSGSAQSPKIRSLLSRSHSLTKPYHTVGAHASLWDFVGSTIVTNSYVRLTSNSRSQQGAVWNTVPCSYRDWEMHIHFKIHGTDGDLFGDGMAIWYSQHRMATGSVFGSTDYFTGLGIFLDTYSNHNGPHHHVHPYISAMVNNGTLHYDHDMDGTLTQVAGCTASNLRHKTYRKHDTLIAIRYSEETLTVSTDIDGLNRWQPCFQAKGVHLPLGYYFGASAATGDLSDNHDIISIRVYELEVTGRKESSVPYPKLPSAQFSEPIRDRVPDPEHSFWGPALKIFLYTCLALAVIAIAIGGTLYYVKHRNDTYYKRFY